jgi:hypothetical protein
MWHVDPLLVNDCEISSCTIAVAKQWICKQWPLVCSGRKRHATTEELLEAVFSVRSVPRLFNEGQLPLEESLETAVKRVGGWCKMAATLVVSQLEQGVCCETVASR